MSTPKPFLFLDSPNVGEIGHAYVVSRNAPMPMETRLSSTANRARNQEPASDFIAISREMVQQETTRKGHELLICAGAFPVGPKDIPVVREVLAGLLTSHVSPNALKSELLQKHTGLIFSAPCLDQITEAFYSDPRIQRISWTSGAPEVVRPALPGSEPKPKNKSLMKWLLIFLLIGTVPFFAQFRKSKNPSSPVSPSSKPTKLSKELESWTFLASGDWDWQRLMEETGGEEACKAHTRVYTKVQNKDLKSISDEESTTTLELLKLWAQTFLEEFPSDQADAKMDTSQLASLISSSNTAKRLMSAKGQQGPCISCWITDYKDQRQQYPQAVKEKAETLAAFSTILSSKDPPSAFRDIWNALESFRKVKTNKKIEPFLELVQDKLQDMNAPPESYSTLTFKDSERVKQLLEILGSKEIGLLLVNTSSEKIERDWAEIRSRIQFSAKQSPQSAPEAKALFEILQKTFPLTEN